MLVLKVARYPRIAQFLRAGRARFWSLRQAVAEPLLLAASASTADGVKALLAALGLIALLLAVWAFVRLIARLIADFVRAVTAAISAILLSMTISGLVIAWALSR
jgi:hypothetical protein